MTDGDTVEIGQLIYHEWSEAFKRLTLVKAEVLDEKEPDWVEFHSIRLQNAIAEEAHFMQLKSRFIDEFREVINRAYGI